VSPGREQSARDPAYRFLLGRFQGQADRELWRNSLRIIAKVPDDFRVVDLA
jgi:hypothetical protein